MDIILHDKIENLAMEIALYFKQTLYKDKHDWFIGNLTGKWIFHISIPGVPLSYSDSLNNNVKKYNTLLEQLIANSEERYNLFYRYFNEYISNPSE